jgi:hypothetical protein
MKIKLILTAIVAAFVITNAVAQTTLQLNLQKGETYYQTNKTNLDVSMSISGMSMAIISASDQKYAFKVVNLDGDNYDLEVVFERLSMSTTTPQASISYSSENPKDAISSALAEATKHSFNIKMNKLGEVLEVTNFDKFLDATLSQNSEIFEAEKQQIKQLLEEARNSISSSISIYPKMAVSTGDIWETTNSATSGGISINSTSKFTLSESTASYNKISGAITLQSDPNAAPMYDPSMGGSIKYKISGTGNIDITLDAKSGWIIEANTKQNVKGDLQIVEAGMDIPLNMTITSSIKNQ